MLKQAIYHKIDSQYAYPLARDRLHLRLRSARADVASVKVICVDKYLLLQSQGVPMTLPMQCAIRDELFDYWEAEVPHSGTALAYCFLLEKDGELLYYGNYQFFDKMLHEAGMNYTPLMFIMPEIAADEVIQPPAWVMEAVIYQIFPDSFYAGDDARWQVTERADAGQLQRPLGGTLRGVTQKLPYLADLGINTVYLNPIFMASHYHKYNTKDHFRIDPQFGSTADLKELVERAHALSMRVILDGVFSATGVDFFAFAQVCQYQQASLFKDWYDVFTWPLKVAALPTYRTFAYSKDLPKLNFSCRDVVAYCLDVMAYWIKEADIDGWRLDVADEIPHSFWRQARQRVDAVKKGTILVGEIWYDASSWLSHDQFDGVMNYLFYTPVKEFFAHRTLSASAFADKIGMMLAMYKKPHHYTNWNLLGSHDTSRFLTEASGNLALLRLAVTFQCTFMGIPMIYYGDEIGLTGGHDPACRGPMKFAQELQNLPLRDYYRQLLALRKKHPALVYGDFRLMQADDRSGLVAYERTYQGEHIVVYLNNGDTALEVPLTRPVYNLLSTQNERVEGLVSLPQFGVAILGDA